MAKDKLSTVQKIILADLRTEEYITPGKLWFKHKLDFTEVSDAMNDLKEKGLIELVSNDDELERWKLTPQAPGNLFFGPLELIIILLTGLLFLIINH